MIQRIMFGLFLLGLSLFSSCQHSKGRKGMGGEVVVSGKNLILSSKCKVMALNATTGKTVWIAENPMDHHRCNKHQQKMKQKQQH